MKRFLEYTGIEPGRLQFSWVSSSEAGKFVEVANKVTAEVKALGPGRHLSKIEAARGTEQRDWAES